MELSEELMRNYTTILKEELVAAMGCTEPIAIAYAAAKARNELGEMPEHMLISCSGNMIKNVKGVTVRDRGGTRRRRRQCGQDAGSHRGRGRRGP